MNLNYVPTIFNLTKLQLDPKSRPSNGGGGQLKNFQ